MNKNVLDFCFVILPNGTTSPISDYMTEYSMHTEFCGLSKIKNTKCIYAVYYDRISELANKGIGVGVCSVANFKGINEDSKNPGELQQSKIPKGEFPSFIIYHDQDGYLGSL